MQSPNRFGAVEKCHGHFSLGAGEEGRFASFDALGKGRGRRHLCKACAIVFCGQTSPQAAGTGMSADESAASSCLMPGSQPECLRHSRGKKSLAGQKDGRHFAAGRETGIFPAKTLFTAYVLAASEIATGNFDAAAQAEQNPPAGRPRALASYRRAIFMGHSVRVLSTEDRPADAGSICPLLVSAWERIFRTPPA